MKLMFPDFMQIVIQADPVNMDFEFIWHGEKFKLLKERLNREEWGSKVSCVEYKDTRINLYNNCNLQPIRDDENKVVGLRAEFDVIECLVSLAYLGLIDVPELVFVDQTDKGLSNYEGGLIEWADMKHHTSLQIIMYEKENSRGPRDSRGYIDLTRLAHDIDTQDSRQKTLQRFADGLKDKYKDVIYDYFNSEIEIDEVKANCFLPQELYALDDYDFREFVESKDFIEVLGDSWRSNKSYNYDKYLQVKAAEKSELNSLNYAAQEYNSTGWDADMLLGEDEVLAVIVSKLYDSLRMSKLDASTRKELQDLIRDQSVMHYSSDNPWNYEVLEDILGINYYDYCKKQVNRFLKHYDSKGKDLDTVIKAFKDSKYVELAVEDLFDEITDYAEANHGEE